jgi:hypothetical protein
VRGSEGQGCSGVYIAGWGHRGGVTADGNCGIMALTPLKAGWVKEGLRKGIDGRGE